MPQVIAVRNAVTVSSCFNVRSNCIAMPHGTYDFLSGSSFSAASVSGLVALALQLQPGLTSADILSTLQRAENDFPNTLLSHL